MRWILKPKPETSQVQRLASELGVDARVAYLLVQRGILTYEQARLFFRPEWSDLHDPFLMKDMDLAVSRIEKAVRNKEKILIYGDYDVDGTTSVALVYNYFKEWYPEVTTYIPDRYLEGYGISFQGIDYASDNDISLVIALDCGIKALDKVRYAAEKGIDFIICDHHTPGESIPDAVAVLDPKRSDCSYPYKELCGCGIGFKLIQAVQEQLEPEDMDLGSFLDLVAVAIAADIVPMTGENRVLMTLGMRILNSNPRPGIKALTEQSKKSEIGVSDVVFIVAPRINAAGRMHHGNYAVSLLTECSIQRAREYAAEIEAFNQERKGLDRQITEEALAQITDLGEEERYTSVVYKDSWHKGVIGIVASRLTETFYRPTLVFTKSNGKLAASARSVKGFDVYQALSACADTIEQFGGHKYAAGLTLKEDQYEKFKAQFEQVVAASIDPQLLTPEIAIDAPIKLKTISPKFLRIIKQFGPFGPGNMTPLFMAENLRDVGFAKQVGEGGKHLRLSVSQEGSLPIGAIGFNLGDKLPMVTGNQSFSAVFSVEENVWNGKSSIQLKIRDIR
ncbi:single-stranded-DNA-specific exonuclease RecJ [Lentiprolixibacter aurantiacus]|uniref:Single-stranded-DNA-specific exonuclease RecJ n=1 Tax=Lentiprolixibacter aurantiacus TaxID=2993939 RepID=A0AAE3MK74_9FLAO|nr:single-stranded-DNA-specific exonuclease RecJ [Lentiprolixibacter aurantiacus]MCX2718404.1 single-stranded-DNA-specific exonuclease RecJ [Lentiprolixibacter aurantiacus]